MNLKQFAPTVAAFCAVVGFIAAPMIANAHMGGDGQRRSQSSNQWKDRAVAGGVVGAIGLLTHNKTLAIAGIAGALYSSSRADSDSRSHDDGRQARAELDRHTSFQHEGHTYVRQTVYKGGQQYHKFNRQD